jgi:hypothetical protein
MSSSPDIHDKVGLWIIGVLMLGCGGLFVGCLVYLVGRDWLGWWS